MRKTDSAREDRLISQGAMQFLSTLKVATQTKAIIISVQADGYTQIHSTIEEPEMTRHLMRAAAGERDDETVQ